MLVGDLEFWSLISSIQTDEVRHAQMGEPTLRIMIQNGKKQEAQRLIDHAFWLSWRMFAVLLTNLEVETPPLYPNRCGGCRRCLDACPTEALLGDGTVSKLLQDSSEMVQREARRAYLSTL